MKYLLAVPSLLMIFVVNSWAQEMKPVQRAGYVTDLAELLSSEERATLESELATNEKKTSCEVVVLTLPKAWMGGQDVGDYARKIAAEWQLGVGKGEKGVILVVARDGEHGDLRIEAVNGIPPNFSDSVAQYIADHEMVPQFKAGHLNEGVLAGARAVVKATNGDYHASASLETWQIVLIVIVILLVLILLMWADDGSGSSGIFDGGVDFGSCGGCGASASW